jgi:glycosyltransferase involved in cell wall biosynthesis
MTQENPLVSVAVFTYNQENTISQTLDSILAQKVDFSVEIIVGEDCSTDKTREICLDYATKYSNIKLILHDINQGALKNYISVIGRCRGKYIAQCAGDDYWHCTEKLKIQIEILEKNLNIGMVHSDVDVYYVDSNKVIHNVNKYNHRSIPNGKFSKYLLTEILPIYTPTPCMRSEILKKIDISKFVAMGFLMEDLPLWLELSGMTDFFYLDKSLATYRIREDSLCRPKELDKQMNFIQSINAVQEYYRDSFFPALVTKEEIEKVHFERLFGHYLNAGQLSNAFLYFKKANDIKPINKLKFLISRSYVMFCIVVFLKNRMKFLRG